MPDTKQQANKAISSEIALLGILALLIDEREDRTRDRKDALRTDVLLANAGVPIETIATITDQKYDAVRMAVARARGTKRIKD